MGNCALLLNRSKTICLLILILFVGIFGNLVNAQTTLSQFDSKSSAQNTLKSSATSSVPTISSLGSTSGCIGTSITINGTSLSGTSAANVKIGGTSVSSISTITNTQIVAVIGNGTTGNVTVTNSGGTATSSSAFTVNPPTVAGTLTPVNTNVCFGSYNSGNLTLSGYTGSIIRWESSTNNFATAGTPISNTGNTQVIGTHTTDTYYRSVIQSGNCNLLYSNSVKITVSGAMPSGTTGISLNGGATYPVSGGARDYCASTSATLSTASIANATSYTWVLPAGWSVVSGQGTTTITVMSGSSSQSGNIEVYASNIGCGNTNRSYLYLHLGNPPPAPTPTPTVTLTQPTCAVATGTITVNTPVPATGITYTVVGTNPVVAAVTNSTGVFSGFAEGTYNVTASNVSGCGPSGALSVTLAMATNTWNGTAWSNGTPTSSQTIVFNGDYPSTINQDIIGCSCIVNTGKNVTIKSGRNLIITNKVTVSGTATLTFEDSASLVQTNNVANSGYITYKRNTSQVSNLDYTYWSSPVATQNLKAVSSLTLNDKFFTFDTSLGNWVQVVNPSTTTMILGKGYIIRGPQSHIAPAVPSTAEALFYGVPNNGNHSIAVVGGVTSNLIGNVYPSALDADAFLNANSAVIDGTLYFWTHNTAIQNANLIGNNPDGTPKAGSGALAYTSDDYATYNLVGGVGTGSGTLAPSGGVKPTGKIAAGQSFFTTSTAAGGTVNFTNTMRRVGGKLPDGTGVNQQFFKTKNSKEKTATTIEKHRIWLNLTNDQGAFKQVLVGYVTDATNDYDSRFDGESFDANEYIDFFSIDQDKNLVIQGRALPFDENDEVLLGFRSTVDGDFTLNIDEADGLLTEQPVFLEDKLTNTVFDLRNGDYTFNTAVGTFDDRFVLRYTSKALGASDFDVANSRIIISVKNKQIKINSFVENIDKVTIYDESGRQIYQKDKVNSNELSIPNFVSGLKFLIVKISLQNGKAVTEKIIY
jgi:hypothetical protein